jgi:hypothetical protein
MEMNFTQQCNALQNRLVQVERNQQQIRFPLRNEIWERNQGPPQNQRPPLSLEPTNVVDHDFDSFFRACQEFYEEATCAIYIELNNDEANNFNNNNYLGTCNNLFEGRKSYSLSQENMKQIKDKGIDFDRVTRMFGENPSQEEVQRMW